MVIVMMMMTTKIITTDNIMISIIHIITTLWPVKKKNKTQ